ncbi:hypothetical protein [Azospirillum argentinense]
MRADCHPSNTGIQGTHGKSVMPGGALVLSARQGNYPPSMGEGP